MGSLDSRSDGTSLGCVFPIHGVMHDQYLWRNTCQLLLINLDPQESSFGMPLLLITKMMIRSTVEDDWDISRYKTLTFLTILRHCTLDDMFIKVSIVILVFQTSYWVISYVGIYQHRKQGKLFYELVDQGQSICVYIRMLHNTITYDEVSS